MANAKNTKVPAEDAMAAVSALIAKAKREGSIQATELTAQLEKLDLPVEKIEHIYDTFDAMGIQIVSPELEIGLDDADDGMGMGMGEGDIPMGDEEEELIDPLELSAVLPGAMDPAGAAELYGYINAGMWTVMPQLEQLTRIPDPGLHVEVDFDSEQLRLTGRLGVSLQIRDLFAIGWAFAKPVIRWLLAMRKRQSAAEKAKAAQNAAKQRETVHTAPDGAGHTTTSTSTKES